MLTKVWDPCLPFTLKGRGETEIMVNLYWASVKLGSRPNWLNQRAHMANSLPEFYCDEEAQFCASVSQAAVFCDREMWGIVFEWEPFREQQYSKDELTNDSTLDSEEFFSVSQAFIEQLVDRAVKSSAGMWSRRIRSVRDTTVGKQGCHCGGGGQVSPSPPRLSSLLCLPTSTLHSPTPCLCTC